MADINIKRFVDININYNVSSSVSSARDTVVLFTTEGAKGNPKTYANMSAWTNDATASSLTTTTEYVKMFFNNGGNKVKVVFGISSAELVDEIAKLDTKEIVVAFAGEYDKIKSAAKTREADAKIYGINQKILLGRSVDLDTDSVKNFAVKYSAVVGAEMTIAAYLSNINVYGNDTVHDYMFTKEIITEEESNDDVLGSVIDNNMNVDMYLSDAVRNLGGNLKDGSDIMNSFMLIVCQQTLTDRLVKLLSTKIKGSKGIAAIYNTIASELSNYLTDGYLTTDKVWTGGTKNVVYNNKTYTIIEDNTPLTLGYYITILPFASLSDTDKAARKCPPIYIFLADSYGIRAVTIQGEVI